MNLLGIYERKKKELADLDKNQANSNRLYIDVDWSADLPVGKFIVVDCYSVIDPTAHAEILVIRKACFLAKNQRLDKCSLYVTLEPCPMCASAISNARISKLYFGPEDKKSGGVINGPQIFSHPQCHHKPEIYENIGNRKSQELLQEFFKSKRFKSKGVK